jgi:hypothetical protein
MLPELDLNRSVVPINADVCLDDRAGEGVSQRRGLAGLEPAAN